VLAEGERATGAQVVVAVFPSLDGESLEDFSIRLAEKWRVGRKALDDGAIILVFVADRKVRIEVGYGLEGAVPDIVAGRIIRESIAPRFREGRYDAGLEAAARAIYAQVETKAPAERKGVSDASNAKASSRFGEEDLHARAVDIISTYARVVTTHQVLEES
jgi:uncharacterized protein